MNVLSVDRRVCLLQLVVNKGAPSYPFLIHSPHQHQATGREDEWQADMIANFGD